MAWLASPGAANVSGNVFIVWGKQITVMEPPKHALDLDNEDPWSIESVGAQLGAFFEGKEAVKDSFIPPAVF